MIEKQRNIKPLPIKPLFLKLEYKNLNDKYSMLEKEYLSYRQ